MSRTVVPLGAPRRSGSVRSVERDAVISIVGLVVGEEEEEEVKG